jgi:hypothetical protein
MTRAGSSFFTVPDLGPVPGSSEPEPVIVWPRHPSERAGYSRVMTVLARKWPPNGGDPRTITGDKR